MRKSILLLAVGILMVSNVAAVDGGSEPVKIHLSIESGKYRLYPDSNRIGFPTLMRGDKPPKYRNATYKEFAKWEVSEKGVEKVEEALKQGISELDGISFGSGQGKVTVEYLKNHRDERGFSYDRLVSETPSRIEGTVRFGGKKVSVSIPVEVSKTTAPEITEAYSEEKVDRSRNISRNISQNISIHQVAPGGNLSYWKRLDQVINTVDSLENVAPNSEDERKLERALELLKSASSGEENTSRTETGKEKSTGHRIVRDGGGRTQVSPPRGDTEEKTTGKPDKRNEGLLGGLLSILL